jgi:hypothetical protein
MDLKITWTCHLKDEKWGFSDLLNGRELNEETKEEIKDLVEEDIYDAIYSDGAMAIEADTSERQLTIPDVRNNEVALKAFVEAFEDGNGGDTELYRKAKRLL